MGFRLVPKAVTLNDLERRNGTYLCALFHRIHERCRRKTVRAYFGFKNLLLIIYDHINTICAVIQRLFGKRNSDNWL